MFAILVKCDYKRIRFVLPVKTMYRSFGSGEHGLLVIVSYQCAISSVAAYLSLTNTEEQVFLIDHD